jgi:hypothetical protein
VDNPTRIGLGGTALFTLAGVGAPIVTWWVSAPVMAACAVAAAWGFWPLIGEIRRAGFPFLRNRVPLWEAARIAYEAAERAGVVDMTTHPGSAAEVRLKFYVYVFLADDKTVLYGAKPPSTSPRPIAREEYKQIHPVIGVDRLDYISPQKIGFENVTIKRKDLNRIIREWPDKSRDFARNFARNLK